MNTANTLSKVDHAGREDIRSLERLCAQLDMFASARGEDRAMATRLIERLQDQDQNREDMIRFLATSLMIVAGQEASARRACLQDIPAIFTQLFN